MKIQINSLSELKKFAAKLHKAVAKESAKNGATIALIGNLGAGKTTFTKFFLAAAGIKKTVTSPTFVLMIPYKKDGAVYYHLDLYRTKNFREIEALGVQDLWQQKGNIFLIEWADKIKRRLPANTIYLKFKIKDNGRQISILNLPAKIAKMIS